MLNLRKLEKSFCRQKDQSDCGVACLSSLIAYYGGYVPLETLREESGTGPTGTTMLGLFQAALKAGMKAKGFSADLDQLSSLGKPCLLHVIQEGRILHFVICYGYQNENFLIGDPAKGIVWMSSGQLDAIWSSRKLLLLEPGDAFVQRSRSTGLQRAWFLGLLRCDWNILATSAFLGVVISVLGLSVAIFTQKLVDDILPNGRTKNLAVGIGVLSILLLMKVAMDYVRQNLLLAQGVGFNKRLIRWFYTSILALPKKYFDGRTVGDFVARLNDGIRIQNFISRVAGSIVIDAFVVLTSIIYVWFLGRTIGIVLLLSILLNVSVIAYFQRSIIVAQREIMVAYAANESNYIDTIQGIGAIKTAGRGSFFASMTQKIYEVSQTKQLDLGRIAIAYAAITDASGIIISLSLMGWMSLQVISGWLALGKMMAAMSVVFGFIPAVGRISVASIQVQEARIAFDRMYGLVSSEREDVCDSAEGAQDKVAIERLDASDLKFRFPGRSQVLKGVSFSARKGTIVAILGENGCGKSTLLHILEKFYALESGQILINGELPWEQISLKSWRKSIASLAQEIKIFNGGLLYNICLSDDPYELQRAMRFCQEAGFQTYFGSFPQGFLTVLGDAGVKISGGQKQMVGLARALYQEPELLLLDEPTAAMDRDSEIFVMELLSRLKTKMAILMVTHKIQTLRFADHIYLLGNGLIEADGTTLSLRASDNFYSRILRDFLDPSLSL